MKYRFDWSPDMGALMESHKRAGERAVSLAMDSAAKDLKLRWRKQIIDAGLGKRLANTIRDDSFPKGVSSLNAAALVWSKAPHIISSYEYGAVIRAKNGLWLAIPTEAAGRGRFGRKFTPVQWERSTGLTLRFVYRKNGFPLLVSDGLRINTKRKAKVNRRRRRKKDGIQTGETTVPIFTLVPQVRVKKRLNLRSAAEHVASTIPARIRANWGE